MKFIVVLFVASVALSGVLALPAGSPNDDAEVIDVLDRHATDDSDEKSSAKPDFTDFKGVIDTGVGYPFLQPHPLPFSFNLGFFDAFEDIFRRLRDQLWSSSLPSDGEGLSLFDSSKGNTTSTVKVVDGHKIEVNETVYGDGGNLFKVRLVNIRPIDSDEDVAATSVSNRNGPNPVTEGPTKNRIDSESDERVEPLEKKSDENEIKRNIDEPESLASLIHDKMLPVTNEDNAANLTAAFVTENSLEVAEGDGNGEQSSEEREIGNIETETNKSVNKEKMEALENTTNIGALEETPLAVIQDDNNALAIENNEKVEENTSSNEPSNADIAADTAATEDEKNASTESEVLRAELYEEDLGETATQTVGFGEVNEEVTSIVDDSADGVGDVAADNNREDVSSSDDEEEGENVEMNPGFESEWADLKEYLATKDNENNYLTNDIDAYDAAPVDLSNDIAINDLAAVDADFAINPDAELIDVSLIQNSVESLRFDKLQVSADLDPSRQKDGLILQSDK